MAKAKQETQSPQEKKLRKYFHSPPKSRGRAILGAFLLIVATILIGLAASATSSSEEDVGAAALVGAAVAGFVGLGLLDRARKRSSLSDQEVDSWFDQRIERLKAHSMSKLGLSENDLVGDETLVITAPIDWTTFGIDDKDILKKVGKDKVVRFSVYRVTIIHLTQHYLDAYSCDYNFLKDVPVNEETDEYHYRHVVSVSTREYQSNYTLPTGVTFTHAQLFSLSVSSGQSIDVIIGSDKLSEVRGNNVLPETGAEKAVAAIRKMLREISAADGGNVAPSLPQPSPLVTPPIPPTTLTSQSGSLWLVDQASGQRHLLRQPVTTIGRALDNDIVLSASTVSGHHAIVRFLHGDYQLSDQNSSNGTFVNGLRLTGPHKLQAGQQVRLGDAQFAVDSCLSFTGI